MELNKWNYRSYFGLTIVSFRFVSFRFVLFRFVSSRFAAAVLDRRIAFERNFVDPGKQSSPPQAPSVIVSRDSSLDQAKRETMIQQGGRTFLST